MKQKETKRLVLLAMFVAIELLLYMIPNLGLIRIFTIEITTLHIPVIIASVVLGVKEGMIIGALFGFLSFYSASTQPLPHAFLFSPLAVNGNFFSLVTVFVPRILIGLIPGLLYEKFKNKQIATPIICFVTSMVHTLLVAACFTVFFKGTIQQVFGFSESAYMGWIIPVITTHGLVEATVAAIIASGSILALKKIYK